MSARFRFAPPVRYRPRRPAGWLPSLILLVAGEAAPAAESSGLPGGEALREMTTDRPDTTESPYTINVGHAQIEGDILSTTRNRLDGTRAREWSVAASNLRVGVSRNLEAGFFLAPWTRLSEEPRGESRKTRSGFGDVTARAKWNIRGNDGGSMATGLILDLTVPTAAPGLGNRGLAGAVTLPIAGAWQSGWEYGAMTRLDLRERPDGPGHRVVVVNSATVGRDLGRRFGGYLELTSAAGSGSHVATFDTGLIFRVEASTQLDGGVRLGITRVADDVALFTGVSRRY